MIFWKDKAKQLLGRDICGGAITLNEENEVQIQLKM